MVNKTYYDGLFNGDTGKQENLSAAKARKERELYANKKLKVENTQHIQEYVDADTVKMKGVYDEEATTHRFAGGVDTAETQHDEKVLDSKEQARISRQKPRVAEAMGIPVTQVTNQDVFDYGEKEKVRLMVEATTGKAFNDEFELYGKVDGSGYNTPVDVNTLGTDKFGRKISSINAQDTGLNLNQEALKRGAIGDYAASRGTVGEGLSGENVDQANFENAIATQGLEDEALAGFQERNRDNFVLESAKAGGSMLASSVLDMIDFGADVGGWAAQGIADAVGMEDVDDETLANMGYVRRKDGDINNVLLEDNREAVNEIFGYEDKFVAQDREEFTSAVTTIWNNDSIDGAEKTALIGKTIASNLNIVPQLTAESIGFLTALGFGGAIKLGSVAAGGKVAKGLEAFGMTGGRAQAKMLSEAAVKAAPAAKKADKAVKTLMGGKGATVTSKLASIELGTKASKGVIDKAVKEIASKRVAVSAAGLPMAAAETNKALEERRKNNNGKAPTWTEVLETALVSTVQVKLDHLIDRGLLGSGKKILGDLGKAFKVATEQEAKLLALAIAKSTGKAIGTVGAGMGVEALTETMQETLTMYSERFGTDLYKDKEFLGMLEPESLKKLTDAGLLGAMGAVGMSGAGAVKGVADDFEIDKKSLLGASKSIVEHGASIFSDNAKLKKIHKQRTNTVLKYGKELNNKKNTKPKIDIIKEGLDSLSKTIGDNKPTLAMQNGLHDMLAEHVHAKNKEDNGATEVATLFEEIKADPELNKLFDTKKFAKHYVQTKINQVKDIGEANPTTELNEEVLAGIYGDLDSILGSLPFTDETEKKTIEGFVEKGKELLEGYRANRGQKTQQDVYEEFADIGFINLETGKNIRKPVWKHEQDILGDISELSPNQNNIGSLARFAQSRISKLFTVKNKDYKTHSVELLEQMTKENAMITTLANDIEKEILTLEDGTFKEDYKVQLASIREAIKVADTYAADMIANPNKDHKRNDKFMGKGSTRKSTPSPGKQTSSQEKTGGTKGTGTGTDSNYYDTKDIQTFETSEDEFNNFSENLKAYAKDAISFFRPKSDTMKVSRKGKHFNHIAMGPVEQSNKKTGKTNSKNRILAFGQQFHNSSNAQTNMEKLPIINGAYHEVPYKLFLKIADAIAPNKIAKDFIFDAKNEKRREYKFMVMGGKVYHLATNKQHKKYLKDSGVSVSQLKEYKENKNTDVFHKAQQSFVENIISHEKILDSLIEPTNDVEIVARHMNDNNALVNEPSADRRVGKKEQDTQTNVELEVEVEPEVKDTKVPVTKIYAEIEKLLKQEQIENKTLQQYKKRIEELGKSNQYTTDETKDLKKLYTMLLNREVLMNKEPEIEPEVETETTQEESNTEIYEGRLDNYTITKNENNELSVEDSLGNEIVLRKKPYKQLGSLHKAIDKYEDTAKVTEDKPVQEQVEDDTVFEPIPDTERIDNGGSFISPAHYDAKVNTNKLKDSLSVLSKELKDKYKNLKVGLRREYANRNALSNYTRAVDIAIRINNDWINKDISFETIVLMDELEEVATFFPAKTGIKMINALNGIRKLLYSKDYKTSGVIFNEEIISELKDNIVSQTAEDAKSQPKENETINELTDDINTLKSEIEIERNIYKIAKRVEHNESIGGTQGNKLFGSLTEKAKKLFSPTKANEEQRTIFDEFLEPLLGTTTVKEMIAFLPKNRKTLFDSKEGEAQLETSKQILRNLINGLQIPNIVNYGQSLNVRADESVPEGFKFDDYLIDDNGIIIPELAYDKNIFNPLSIIGKSREIGKDKNDKPIHAVYFNETTTDILSFYVLKMYSDAYEMSQTEDTDFIKDIFSLDADADTDVIIEAMIALREGNIPRAALIQGIGKDIYQTLGLQANQNIDQTLEDMMVTALGQFTVSALTDLGLFDAGVSTVKIGEDQKDHTVVKVNPFTSTNPKGNPYYANKEQQKSLRQALTDFSYLVPTANAKTVSSEPITQHSGKIRKSNYDMAQESLEYILEQQSIAWTYNNIVDKFQTLRNDGFKSLWIAAGWKSIAPDDIHPMDMEKQKSINMQIELDFENLFRNHDLIKDTKFYLPWDMHKSDRYMIDSDINPQSSKIFRFIMQAAGMINNVKVSDFSNQNKDLQYFKLALAQAFDLDLDKQSDISTISYLDKMLEIDFDNKTMNIKDKNLELVMDFMENPSNEKDYLKAIENLGKNGEAIHAIQAANELNTLRNMFKDENNEATFSSALLLESDAITSGMALTLLQIGSKLSMDLLVKTGVYTKEVKPVLQNLLLMGDKEASALVAEHLKTHENIDYAVLKKSIPNYKENPDVLVTHGILNETTWFEDLYSDIGMKVFHRIGDKNQALLNKAERPLTPKYGDDPKAPKFTGPRGLSSVAIAALNISDLADANFKKEDGTYNYGKVRKLAKEAAVMVYIYGSSINSIKKNLGYELGQETLMSFLRKPEYKRMNIDAMLAPLEKKWLNYNQEGVAQGMSMIFQKGKKGQKRINYMNMDEVLLDVQTMLFGASTKTQEDNSTAKAQREFARFALLTFNAKYAYRYLGGKTQFVNNKFNYKEIQNEELENVNKDNAKHIAGNLMIDGGMVKNMQQSTDAIYGEAFDEALQETFHEVNDFRDSMKIVQILVHQIFNFKLKKAMTKALVGKKGLTKAQLQDIVTKLVTSGMGHNIPNNYGALQGLEATEKGESLKRIGVRQSNITNVIGVVDKIVNGMFQLDNTQSLVSTSTIEGNIQQRNFIDNSRAAPTISIHSIDGYLIAEATKGLDVLNIYDALGMSTNAKQYDDQNDLYNEKFIIKGREWSTLGAFTEKLENMIGGMSKSELEEFYTEDGFNVEDSFDVFTTLNQKFEKGTSLDSFVYTINNKVIKDRAQNLSNSFSVNQMYAIDKEPVEVKKGSVQKGFKLTKKSKVILMLEKVSAMMDKEHTKRNLEIIAKEEKQREKEAKKEEQKQEATKPVKNDNPSSITKEEQEAIAKVINDVTSSAGKNKDNLKALVSTQFIGFGRPDSSTDKYREVYTSVGRANTGKYTKDDVIFVSVNGGNANTRIKPLNAKKNGFKGGYSLVGKAMDIGATIITDTAEYLNSSTYNNGEKELGYFLRKNGYELNTKNGVGVWTPVEGYIKPEVKKTTPKKSTARENNIERARKRWQEMAKELKKVKEEKKKNWEARVTKLKKDMSVLASKFPKKETTEETTVEFEIETVVEEEVKKPKTKKKTPVRIALESSIKANKTILNDIGIMIDDALNSKEVKKLTDIYNKTVELTTKGENTFMAKMIIKINDYMNPDPDKPTKKKIPKKAKESVQSSAQNAELRIKTEQAIKSIREFNVGVSDLNKNDDILYVSIMKEVNTYEDGTHKDDGLFYEVRLSRLLDILNSRYRHLNKNLVSNEKQIEMIDKLTVLGVKGDKVFELASKRGPMTLIDYNELNFIAKEYVDNQINDVANPKQDEELQNMNKNDEIPFSLDADNTQDKAYDTFEFNVEDELLSELNEYFEIEGLVSTESGKMETAESDINYVSNLQTLANNIATTLKELNLSKNITVNRFITEGRTRGQADTIKGVIDLRINEMGDSMFSPSEIFMHEITHIFTHNILLANPGIKEKIREIQEQIQSKTTYEIFLEDPTTATSEDVALAKKIYDYAIEGSESEFLAYSMTNRQMFEATKNIAVSNTLIDLTSGSNKFYKIINKFISLINKVHTKISLSGEGKRGKITANTAMQKLTVDLIALQAKLVDKKIAESEPSTGFMKAYNRFDTKYEKMSDVVGEKISRIAVGFDRKLTSSTFLDKITNINGLIQIKNSNFFQDIYTELTLMTTDKRVAGFYDLFREVKKIQEADKESFRNELELVYGEELEGSTKNERKALKRLLVDTDAHALFNYGYSITNIRNLLDDPIALRKEIMDLRASFGSTNEDNAYMEQAQGLGYYLVNKETPVYNQMKNANNIYHGFFDSTQKFKKASNKEDTIERIDKLATLYALEYSGKENKELAIKAIDDNSAGVVTVLNSYKSYMDQYNKRLFDEIGMHSNIDYEAKGYSFAVYDEALKATLVKEDDVKTYKMMGMKIVKEVEGMSFDQTPGKKYLMVGGNYDPAYHKGAMDTIGLSHTGTTLSDMISTDKDSPYKVEDIISVLKIEAEGHTSNNEEMNIDGMRMKLMPSINLTGEITDYKTEMSHDEKVDFLKMNDDITSTVSNTLTNTSAKYSAFAQNEKVVRYLLNDAAQHIHEDPTDFVLIEPSKKGYKSSTEKEWAIIPEYTKQYIYNTTGNRAIYVRKALLNDVVGYHAASMANIGNLKKKHPKVYRAIRMMEHYWMNVINKFKGIIVTMTSDVVIGNMVSNMFFAMQHGVNPVEFAKSTIESWKLLDRHKLDSAELNQLMIRKNGGQAVNEARIKALEQKLKDNMMSGFIERGMFTPIVEDININVLRENNKLDKLIDKATNRLPASVNNVLDVLYLNENTGLYQHLLKMIQYGDITARYAIAKKLRKEGKSENETYRYLDQLLVNYSYNENKYLRYFNDVGFFMFSKYFLRTPKAIIAMMKNNATMASVFQAVQYGSGIDVIDPMDTFYNPIDAILARIGSPVDMVFEVMDPNIQNLWLDPATLVNISWWK